MKLFERVHGLWLLFLGALLIGALHAANQWAGRALAQERGSAVALRKAFDQASTARDHIEVLQELKASDLEKFKEGFSGLAISRKTLFEAGLSQQEERRLLDKQLEIMTTYLFINPALQRVFLMRSEQPLQSYLISYIPLRAFGGVATHIPNTVRIVSKERFAHPERGKSEVVNGKLQYMPPQVGTSLRSKALGEYVVFTNSKLILHGPPVSPEDHEKFPHICVGLDLDAARRIYRGTFIGTRILLNASAVVRREPPAETAPPIPSLLPISSATAHP